MLHKPSFRKLRIPIKLSWIMQLSPDGKKVILAPDKKLRVIPLSGKLGSEFPGASVIVDRTCFLCVLLVIQSFRGWKFDEIEEKSPSTEKRNPYEFSIKEALAILNNIFNHLYRRTNSRRYVRNYLKDVSSLSEPFCLKRKPLCVNKVIIETE